MIKDYDNDLVMAELGRRSARYTQIKQAREALRDAAVQLGLSNDIQLILGWQRDINNAVEQLIEALKLS